MGLFEGKKGLILGVANDHSIAWAIAQQIMAEGVRDIFALLHGTIRKHGQQRQTVRLRNAWVDVDPRGWKTRDDMTINVGLGAGGKLLVWDKVLGLGTTDPLAGFASATSNLVVSFYFAKRGFENVARII